VNVRSRIALIAAAVVTLVASMCGQASTATAQTSATRSSGSEVFCQDVGYNAWCNLADGIDVSGAHFNAAGQYCMKVTNRYRTRKSVTVDLGSSLGALHPLASSKSVILCRAVPNRSVRVTVRVRMNREIDLSAGTWLIAHNAAKRIVTSRKMVATKAHPSISLCARNIAGHKAMLYMYWENTEVGHTQQILPGKIGCVGFTVGGPGFVNVKTAWLNARGVYGLESWMGRRY
jgi:hypothetical protein